MPGLGKQNHRLDVIGKDKLLMVGPIENKMEFHFRMVQGNALEGLIGKPSNAFQPSREE